jgi:hypothetical protein
MLSGTLSSTPQRFRCLYPGYVRTPHIHLQKTYIAGVSQFGTGRVLTADGERGAVSKIVRLLNRVSRTFIQSTCYQAHERSPESTGVETWHTPIADTPSLPYSNAILSRVEDQEMIISS